MEFMENAVIDKLPKHLKSFIIDQNYSRYTPQDQAVWRYVMRQNVNYLGDVAHESYLNGLHKAGISVNHIPSTDEMNAILAGIGWAAVTVDGFIPPAAFMEFQKHHVLVIAADIRAYDQIEYTPAPDIIHEAAGHAPIIADPEYAEYLRYFGEIGSRAFSSRKDYEIYEVIRHLSILKADPFTPEDKIIEAEECLERVTSEAGMPSEMTLIRNLHWWTVEYGLIGDLAKPKIYGAGLLSSIGESMGALKDDVIKLPYSLDAMDYSFDITKPQPQLFVTPDFGHLTTVLNEFADQMGLRTGGLDGMMKAIESVNVATAIYSSGLQVSGIFSDVIVNEGQLAYIKTTGPTTLNYGDKMLKGHGKNHHAHGFGAPVGRLRGTLKPTRLLTDNDLKHLGIIRGEKCELRFETGIIVSGVLKDIARKQGKLILMTFTDCTVNYEDQLLFEPDWGVYDMAVGEKIISVFSGPADPEGYGLKYEAPGEKTHQIDYDLHARTLHDLYAEVREMRESTQNLDKLTDIEKVLESEYPGDWLLPVEMLELIRTNKINGELENKITQRLTALKTRQPELNKLIENGLILA
jgi:phenylalanine-4-hydroxylase